MPTPVIHPKTEPLRVIAAQLDAAPAFAKGPYVKELVDRLLAMLAEELHARDKLEQRVASLERFPETRT